MNTNLKNKSIYLALLSSFIGNNLYIVFVSVILLKLNFSSSYVATSTALTIIPNLIFGPMLGRYADRSFKRIFHTRASILIFLILLIFNVIVFHTNHSISYFLIPLLMIVYNFVFSPLNTIIYQYLIPSLNKDEDKAYIIWERYQGIGTLLGGIISFLLLKFELLETLLVIDGISFLICGATVHYIWKNEPAIVTTANDKINETTPKDFKFHKLLNKKFNKSILVFATLSVCVYVFAIDSHTYNSGILFINQYNIKIEYVPLIISLLSSVNILGTYIYEKLCSTFSMITLQKKALLVSSIAIMLLAISVKNNLPILGIICLVIVQVIEPIWSTANIVCLRQQIREGHYGEFMGYFRIIRSLFTGLGILLYGAFQDSNQLSILITVQSVVLLIPMISFFKTLKTRSLYETA